MNIYFKVVVEPKEWEQYAEVIDASHIIKAPENFSERGQGSIPVRNYVLKRSREIGHKKHWIMDDNIELIKRYNKNMKIPCKSITPFRVCEDFTDRYKNVGLSGMNYAFFCPAGDGRPPFQVNTRVYSCILFNNEIPFEWRGKYNEDTDLSLRVLKAGWNTILFNAFLIEKRATMQQKGGNTEAYAETNKRKEFAESLVKQHPDVVKIVERFGRYHHQVNYNSFKTRDLEYKNGCKPKKGINNYGMKLYKVRA